MRRVGFLCLMLLIALTVMGATYGQWMSPVTATTSAQTGTIAATFFQVKSNDDGTAGNTLDPNALGSWNFTTWVWTGTRATGNDASTSLGATGTTVLPVTVTTSPPRAPNPYYPSIAVSVKNTGTIPVKVTATVTLPSIPPAGSPFSIANSGGVLIPATWTVINPGASATGDITLLSTTLVKHLTYNGNITLTVKPWIAP